MSLRAKKTPVDSIIVVSETRIIVIMALISKRGTPKKNNCGVWNQAASLTGLRETKPNAPAMKEEIKIPSKMAIDFIKPRAKALNNRMMAIVRKPIRRLAGSPNEAAVGVPPPRSWKPTGTRVNPIIVIKDPVTTGGKNFFKRAKKPAIRKTKIPAAIMAPYI